MDQSVEEVLKYIEEEDVKFIRLAFRDAFGIQKNISVSPGEVKKAFEDGIPINAGEITGFRESAHAAMFLKPDASTLSILPWRPDSGRVLRMFCDVYTPEGMEYEADTRKLLKSAVQKAAEAGIEFRFGTESEFYLFKRDDAGNPTKQPYDEAGYLDIAPLDRCENVRREISLTIEQMGLTPERSHHERGPGQNEIDFHYAKPLKAADQMTTFKMVVETIADRFGLYADFSPTPLPGKPGNGFHISLYAVDKEGHDVARYAAAGILEQIREITLFLNPTEASYSRLGNYRAPDRANWSVAGGSELIYIEEWKGKTRAQLRSPDASGNPYLMYALLIFAGLSGIERKLSLPEEMDEKSVMLPSSRKEACQAVKESEFVKSVVPGELIRAYTEGC